jgi:hypothetical protein
VDTVVCDDISFSLEVLFQFVMIIFLACIVGSLCKGTSFQRFDIYFLKVFQLCENSQFSVNIKSFSDSAN